MARKNHNKLHQAVSDKNLDEVLRLIPLSRSREKRTKALRLAAFMGNHEIVKLLAPVSDCHEAVVGSVCSNDHQSFDLLLKMSPNSDQTQALAAAAEFNKIEFVKKLLSYANPNCDKWTCPLLKAAWNGQVESLQLLLSVYDPKRFNSKALQVVAVPSSTHNIGKWMCMELLYDISDVDLAISELKKQDWDENAKNLEAFGHYRRNEKSNSQDSLHQQTYREVNTSKLHRAVRYNKIEEVQYLIPISDPSDQNHSALLTAIIGNQTQCVELLLPFYKWNQETDYLTRAAQHDCVDVLKILLPLATPDQINAAFVGALKNNHVECSDFLKPLVTNAHLWAPKLIEYDLPTYGCLFAIQELIEMVGIENVSPNCIGNAAKYSHINCVQELIKYFSPKEFESFALQSMISNHMGANHLMMQFLYPLCDASTALNALREKGDWSGYKKLELVQQDMLQKKMHETLHQINNSNLNSPIRKM